MEPMNLGSPPSSPGSPNPNFLPAYLMGDTQQITSPSNPAISPGRTKSPLMMKPGAHQQYSQNMRQKLLFNQCNLSDFNQSASSPFASPSAEKGGPPKTGLFDLPEKGSNTPVLSSTMRHPTSGEPPAFSMNESTMFDTIDGSFRHSGPPHHDSYACYNQDGGGGSSERRMPAGMGRPPQHINTLWVTVFGFVPSSTSLILAQLANCGTIQEKKYPTQGNWIHIKYCSTQEVAKALLLNGKLISNSIMIGVLPYYSKSDMDKENHAAGGGGAYTSPIRARPLRASTVPPMTSNTVMSPPNVPQKSTGIVTKAMEYIFGW